MPSISSENASGSYQAEIRHTRAASAPVQSAPRPRPTLSFAPVFGHVRGVIKRGTVRSRTTELLSASRKTKRDFADLVLQILQGEALGSPENGTGGESRIPHLEAEGSATLREFTNHATELEKDLQNFQGAVRELGSSRELTRAALNMRKSVSLTSRLFEENARKLFPRAMALEQPGPSNSANANNRGEARTIYVELKAMEDSVRYLRRALEQFLEFDDIAEEDMFLLEFEDDLKYWSLCLERHRNELESRELQLYIHDLSKGLAVRFEGASQYLRKFIDGVPAVRLAQNNFMASLQNLATIATFFSAVTATTIQYSYTKNNDGVDKVVNMFWFNSLVFSIASALNSFLVLTWRRANYSSPRLQIPWWLWIWILQCPPVFLLISVVAFLLGLGFFTVSSGQAHFTSVIVIISEAISAFGLAALLVWLAYDKWSFYRRRHSQLPVLKFPHILHKKADSLLPTNRERVVSSNTCLPFFQTLATKNSLTRAKRKERARQRWILAKDKVVALLQAGRKERGQEFLESLRMDRLDSRIRKLTVCDTVERHYDNADTKDIHFDPHGKALAICGDTLSMMVELDSSRRDENRGHIGGQPRQIVCTPSAGYLVTRTHTAMYVWRPWEPPVRQRHITRDKSHYILGLPDPTAPDVPKLLSIEGERLNKLAIFDIQGHEHMVHEFKDILIRHVDTVPNGTRALLVAEIPRVAGDHPITAPPGRKLMVFNIKNRLIEHEVLLWHHVQHITTSVNGKWAVVTYKDSLPPQLWRLRDTADGVQLSLERQFCARERISADDFDPSQNVRFSGRAHFVGSDRYVLCATTEGKIHIWRRDMPHSIHVNSGFTLEQDKPVQIACNRARSDDFMFATRSHDGTVRTWRIQDPPTNHAGALNADSANSTGPARILTLNTMSDTLLQASPQSERSPATDIGSARNTHLPRLLIPSSGGPHTGRSIIDLANSTELNPLRTRLLLDSPTAIPEEYE